MIEVRETLNRSNNEINQYCTFINDFLLNEANLLFRDGKTKRINVTLSSTLKSSFFLMLYNLIESTIVNVLDHIHNEVIDERLEYNKLSDSFQNIWLEYYISNRSNANLVKSTKKAIDDVLINKKFDVSFKEYVSIKPIFSGNLDSRKIKEIAFKYGIDIQRSKFGSRLLKVKHKRNKLAHGEVTYSQGGKDIVSSEIELIKEDVIEFLKLFITSAENFLTKKLFVKKSVRPKLLPLHSSQSNINTANNSAM